MLQNRLDHGQRRIWRHRFGDGCENSLQGGKESARNGVKMGVGIRWELIELTLAKCQVASECVRVCSLDLSESLPKAREPREFTRK